MKVTVIGGGSSYTPELVNGFLERVKSFPLTELWLVDIDPQRLEIVGGFAQRMVKAKRSPFKVFLTTDRREGVCGARSWPIFMAYLSSALTFWRTPLRWARRSREALG